jgi:threonine/homoserine/homoserine lactone efflux protein
MAFMALQAVGAAYLVYLGFGLLRAQASAAPHTTPATQNHLRKAFLITVLNPKAIFFYLAFFPQFIKSPVPHPLTTFATLAGTVAVITAIYCTALCAFAAHVSHRFGGNQSAAAWLQRALGVGLIAFGVSLFRLESLPL